MQNLQHFAELVATRVSNYLIAFAAVGTLTMAVVQAVKELTPVRSWFNRWVLERWLLRCHAALTVKAQTVAGVERELIGLATAGDAAALFDLEIERLAGQLSAAAAVVVDFPSKHAQLLKHLAVEADRDDVDAILTADDLGRAHLDQLRSKDAKRFDEVMDGKARVTHQIQRNIDAFQIEAAFRWKWLMQLASFAVSYVITTIGLVLTSDADGVVATIGRSIPIAIAAGFVAPIARDLIAVLNKARQP